MDEQDPATGGVARIGPEELIDDRYLLDTFLEFTPDHVYFKDANSRFLRISRTLARWLGLDEPTEAIGLSDFDFFGEQHAQKAFADEQRLMQVGDPLVGIEEHETWPDGRETWVSTTKAPLRDRNGNIVGVFGISRDITERKLAEQQLCEQAKHLAEQQALLEQLATTDDLTGVYNRRGLSMVGEQRLYEARAHGTSLSILFIDLDGMKEINDTFGHRAGDDALRSVARTLVGTARETDLAARIGGDEFCLLVSADADGGTEALKDRIERALGELNASAGRPYALSVSIGALAIDPRMPGSLEEMLNRADESMYERKHGRDRHGASNVA